MDVDNASKDAVQFSSSDNANGKAKRTAADLPVAAQDNLPWCVIITGTETVRLLTCCVG